MRLSGWPLAANAWARLGLSPARLWLAWLSLIAVGVTLLWLQRELGELRAAIGAVTRFVDGTLHELSATAQGGGYYQLTMPMLDAAKVDALFGAGTPRILVAADPVAAIDREAGRGYMLDVGVAIGLPWPEDGGGATCVVLGGAQNLRSRQMSFDTGVSCRVVAVPQGWVAVDRVLDTPLLVMRQGLARDVLPPLWEARLRRLLLSLPAPVGEGGDTPRQRALRSEGWSLAARVPAAPAEARQVDRLLATMPRIALAGALLCALMFLVLLLGQRRLLRREAGLWLCLGADSRRICRWVLADLAVQLGVVLAPSALLLAVVVAYWPEQLSSGHNLLVHGAALAGLMALVAAVFGVVFCRQVRAADPGLLLKELQ